jgi:uncharacterized membrane protein SpoIIM required for sporulation
MSDTAKNVAAALGVITALAFANLAAEKFAGLQLPHGLADVLAFALLIATVVALAVAAFKVTAPEQPSARTRRLDQLEQQAEHAAAMHEWQQEQHERRRNETR